MKVLVHLIPAKREALKEPWFLSLADARRIIDAWRQDYNTVRPHSAVGYRTPEEFEQRGPNGECRLQGRSPGPADPSGDPRRLRESVLEVTPVANPFQAPSTWVFTGLCLPGHRWGCGGGGMSI